MRDDAVALAGDLVDLRRRLHRAPEVGLQLPRTQETVLEALRGLPLEITTGTTTTSVTAVLRGARSDRAVLLRGDLDALPLQEQSGEPFTSEVDGAMHACGHDLHTAMLVGAAQVLSAHRDALDGDVVFMFQPGEEGWDGASHMIAEGVLDAAGPRVSSAYGLHVMASTYAPRTVNTRPGTVMAARATVEVTLHGAGGHGSAPFRARDPISALAEVVSGLHAMITRRFDVFDPVVLTVGRIEGGTKSNIIPDSASFDATVRTFSAGARERMLELVPQVCHDIARAHGCEAEVVVAGEYPATVNDGAETAFVTGVAAELLGADRVVQMSHPETGAEDFSRVLEAVPGAFAFLGAAVGDPERTPSNHSPRAVFDESVMSDGVLLHAELARRSLQRHP
ncbi:M20 metallopeptidase family protein [Actinomycetospora termitidis]|uniref:M20 family metallopeptidase n=1 Tax=Actinomycetospora termitidis TaxID=3053470 RepID=A0ABT7MC76_9PSEU|nr:M20 family metallopeptidase [Actinomycetospora sp. Odt1-22]MDL5157003.1 M20 family metallopeptidase [Actinomycetospora sp. Odt1-22]